MDEATQQRCGLCQTTFRKLAKSYSRRHIRNLPQPITPNRVGNKFLCYVCFGKEKRRMLGCKKRVVSTPVKPTPKRPRHSMSPLQPHKTFSKGFRSDCAAAVSRSHFSKAIKAMLQSSKGRGAVDCIVEKKVTQEVMHAELKALRARQLTKAVSLQANKMDLYFFTIYFHIIGHP